MTSERENISSSDESSSNESLNCMSTKFDPLKALYSKEIRVPGENCRTYDNLAVFETALKKCDFKFGNKQLQGGSEQLIPECSISSAVASTSAQRIEVAGGGGNRGRNFLPHQMAIKTSGALKSKHFRNLFSKMDDMEGPLAVAQKYKEEKQKVKIYTRKEKGIRGYLIGFIIAFDSHWNFLLDDAYEVWQRRKYKFSPNNAVLGEPMNYSKRLDDLGITIPRLEIKSLNKKYVECRRKVNQILIRGEQIVLIHPVTDMNNF